MRLAFNRVLGITGRRDRKGETAELFAGETCGVSEADRDLVEISKADRLISFDDPLIVGLSDFA